MGSVQLTDAPVLICLLGQFRVLKRGREMALREGSKTQRLLGHLALQPGRGVRRDALLAALWPDRELSQASQSLNTLVYSIHQLLGDGIGGAAPIVQGSGVCRLNLEAGVAVDLSRFESLAAEGRGLAQAGQADAAVRVYLLAIDCYRGDLSFADDTGSLIERERLRVTYLALLANLADHFYQAGDYPAALDSALRLLGQDPCREDAHRLVMRCHVRCGERAQALRQYRICEEVLASEYEAVPEPATVTLFDLVRLQPHVI